MAEDHFSDVSASISVDDHLDVLLGDKHFLDILKNNQTLLNGLKDYRLKRKQAAAESYNADEEKILKEFAAKLNRELSYVDPGNYQPTQGDLNASRIAFARFILNGYEHVRLTKEAHETASRIQDDAERSRWLEKEYKRINLVKYDRQIGDVPAKHQNTELDAVECALDALCTTGPATNKRDMELALALMESYRKKEDLVKSFSMDRFEALWPECRDKLANLKATGSMPSHAALDMYGVNMLAAAYEQPGRKTALETTYANRGLVKTLEWKLGNTRPQHSQKVTPEVVQLMKAERAGDAAKVDDFLNYLKRPEINFFAKADANKKGIQRYLSDYYRKHYWDCYFAARTVENAMDWLTGAFTNLGEMRSKAVPFDYNDECRNLYRTMHPGIMPLVQALDAFMANVEYSDRELDPEMQELIRIVSDPEFIRRTQEMDALVKAYEPPKQRRR